MSEQQLPEGWQMVKFGDIAHHISKRVEPSETDLEIYVGLEHLDPDSLKIKRHGVPSDVDGQKLLVKKGQIIFGKRRAYQRKVAVADWDCICSAHAMVLEANPANVIPEFLPFFMQSDVFMSRAVSISEGSLSPTIKWKILENQSFLMPSLKLQSCLTEIFKKCDENIDLLHEKRKSGFVLIDSILKELVFNKSNGIKHIPLGELCNGKNSIVDGPFGSSMKSEHYRDEGVPIIQSGFVTSNKFFAPSYIYISQELFTKLKRSAVYPGDIVMAKIGEYCGKCARLPYDHEESILASNSLKISCKETEINPDFLVAILQFMYSKTRLREIKSETAQPAISLKSLKSLKVPIPNVNLQNEISKSWMFINEISERITDEINNLMRLKKSLINK